ncbi:hypothetical protein Q765_13080 [Flavobacterium rivuli WB 3.3-2 = DSM 21788]|uniref:HEPN domain-containing protein n=1 Tax=Flavobacterium rivuli WB 3.3-2 = DSM 21788 TaxID=1121895 RepID=A0A0A2M2Z2_9FLAO|nr:hypothetical protein [Flavobacterium rivuli]KGO85991.1 hypothetical protein Q765_13080 [Flavobacterium rivuli WB 3.3-2 = DSM 21788]
MEHNINIPVTHLEREALQKLVNILLEFLPLHSIFSSVERTDIGPKTIITILLSKECTIDSEDVEPLVKRAFKSHPQFTFALFELWWAKDLWKQGSPFFMLYATENELIYSSDSENLIFSMEHNNSKKLIRNAKKQYLEINAWSHNSFTHITWYERYGDYKQAAFHLHQALKYTFQIASWILRGEYTSSESLEEQQLYIADVAPAFGKMFDPENSEEQAVLEQLDNSCNAVRRNETFVFTEDAVLLGNDKAKQFSNDVGKLFKTRIKECKKKIKAAGKATDFKTIEGSGVNLCCDSGVAEFIEELRTTTFFKLSHKRKGGITNGINLQFSSYTELLFTIRDLLKISLHTLYNDDLENSGQIADPSFHLQRLLEITIQLIPHSEGEILDECHQLHLKLKE